MAKQGKHMKVKETKGLTMRVIVMTILACFIIFNGVIAFFNDVVTTVCGNAIRIHKHKNNRR